MARNVCPECAQGKHDNCDRTAWHDERDEVVDCDCAIGEHEPERVGAIPAVHAAENDALTTGHDMSRYWRLVSNEGGLITGTWWVTRPDNRGEQHVRPIDVVMWSEGRHSGLTLHSETFTAFVHDGEVEPINVRARHSHVEAEANARLDEIATAVLTVAAAPEWPEEA